LAGWAIAPGKNWLPNLSLAGNPVTRIPDFVQPWLLPHWLIGPQHLIARIQPWPSKN
jgi:hypothetical protein